MCSSEAPEEHVADFVSGNDQGVVGGDGNGRDSGRVDRLNVDQSAIGGCEDLKFAGAVADNDEFTVGTERHTGDVHLLAGLQLPHNLAPLQIPVRDPSVHAQSQQLVAVLVVLELDDSSDDGAVGAAGWRSVHLTNLLEGLLTT